MRTICCVLLICIQLLLLTGCWDAKEIQNINYATAIGVDYKDKQYVVYLQFLDFANVAKVEGAKPEKARVTVGKGIGLTVNDAINEMYRSSQELVFWGNITAIVFSESVMEKGIDEILDIVNRYREIRYTKWVFGTKVPMEHLLSVTPFFERSPLSSILHEPDNTYHQASFIKPIRMNAFIAEYHEPMTIVLPRISTTKKTWVANEKTKEMLVLQGAYLIDKALIGKLSQASLIGLRWINSDSVRDPVLIKSEGKPAATLIASKPKHKIDWKLSEGKLIFHLTVHVSTVVSELIQDIDLPDIKKVAAQTIKKEIRSTYLKGLEIEADPYNLGHELFKDNPSVWHQYWADGGFPLNERSLDSIDVHVYLENSGKYKLKP